MQLFLSRPEIFRFQKTSWIDETFIFNKVQKVYNFLLKPYKANFHYTSCYKKLIGSSKTKLLMLYHVWFFV